MILFLNLLLAHLVGDFVFQWDTLCEQKREKGLRSWFMWVHPAIVTALTWLMFGRWCFVLGAVITYFSHLWIDAVKSRFERRGRNVWLFVGDQLLHVVVIAFLSWMYGSGWSQFAFVPVGYEAFATAVACALILCVKPANIFIKGIFDWYKIEVPSSGNKKGNDLNNAGALIGSVERIIIMILILLGQYEAVGFVVAAKSLMRFKDSEGAKAEYVLVGTLLSLCVAMVCAVGVKMGT